MLSVEELMEKFDNKGKITDKETAIELLTISPKAWNLLSNELKQDEELMLYYQPKRYVETEEGPTYGAAEVESGGRLYDKEFKIEGKVTVSCVVSVSIKSVMPNCVLKKSKSFRKAYMAVQNRLDYKPTSSYMSKISRSGKENYEKLTENMNGIYGYTQYQLTGPTDGYFADYCLYEADFSKLPEIVNEEYKKYLKTTRR